MSIGRFKKSVCESIFVLRSKKMCSLQIKREREIEMCASAEKLKDYSNDVESFDILAFICRCEHTFLSNL